MDQNTLSQCKFSTRIFESSRVGVWTSKSKSKTIQGWVWIKTQNVSFIESSIYESQKAHKLNRYMTILSKTRKNSKIGLKTWIFWVLIE